jgi:flagellar basal-body rod protein FlgB
MGITDIPIFSMLRTRMEWHQARQKVLAENVANADTASYRPRDLVQPKFERETQSTAVAVSLARTEGGHIGGSSQTQSPFRSQPASGLEVRPTGNAVNLEDEMMKVAANQMDFQAATALYTHSLNLIKTALGRR